MYDDADVACRNRERKTNDRMVYEYLALLIVFDETDEILCYANAGQLTVAACESKEALFAVC